MIGSRWRRNAARARARGAPAVPYGAADVLGKTGGRCYLCGAGLTERWQVEHIIPISRGGADVLANVMPACPDCNRRKGTKLVTLPDGTLRRALLQTAIVQARLARVGVPCLTVLDGLTRLAPIMAPHVITLKVLPAPGHAYLTAPAIAEVRAGVDHPAARVYQHGAEVRIEIPRWPRPVVRLADMPRAGLAFGIGVDTLNRVVAVDFATSPHALVAGQSRSGKSTVLQVMAYQLAALGAGLILVDTDGETFRPFASAAALALAVADTTEAAHAAIVEAGRMMDARPVDVPALRPLVLLVDEVHLLSPATRDLVLDIARRGAKRRTFVVLATHRPTRDDLPKVLTDQLSWRISGTLGDSAGSRVALGVSGAEHLQGRGDMLVSRGGRIERIQAAYGTGDDWARLEVGQPGAIPGGVSLPAAERYARRPNDERVSWLIERFKTTGQKPSQYALNQAFGGSARRNTRARDEALALLAVSN